MELPTRCRLTVFDQRREPPMPDRRRGDFETLTARSHSRNSLILLIAVISSITVASPFDLTTKILAAGHGLAATQERKVSQDATGTASATQNRDAPQDSQLGSPPPKPSNIPSNIQVPDTQPKSRTSFHVVIVYSPDYLINLGGLENMHPFDIKKYQKIHSQLVEDGLLTDQQTQVPAPLTTDDLKMVHSEKYLEELKSRKNIARYLEAPVLEYAPMALDAAVLAPFRHASGGTLLAARKALESGIGINIGGGYHHAKPDTGEGFCIYADIPIAIKKLQQEKQIQSALIIDVDVHQGNGTAVCLADDDSTFCFSMHEADIFPYKKEESDLDVALEAGLDDEAYLKILAKNLEVVFSKTAPDICFVVGGCDTLLTDPLASTEMTPEGIVKRDLMIVQACVDRNVPVVLTMAGGYSTEAWKAQYLSIKKLIETFGLKKTKAVGDNPNKTLNGNPTAASTDEIVNDRDTKRVQIDVA